MAHSRRRTGEGVEAARREMAGRERERERERWVEEWIQGWRRRRSAARNKRNLTWRPAHFLNGMFPLPLRDIMHLWITDEKSPFAASLLFFRPSPHRSGKRSRDCAGSFSLAMFSLSRRDAAAVAMLAPMRIDTSDSYALCRISHRVYLNGILYAVSTWRSLSIPSAPARSPPLSLLSLSRDDACLIVFVLLPRAIIRDL